MENVFVRSMEESDIPAVSRMFVALHEHLNKLGSLWRLNPDWLDDYLQMMLSTRFGRVFTLIASGETIGFICVSTPKVNKKFIAGDIAYTGLISELFIEPPHRGKAYARMLLSAAEDYCKSMNIHCIQVEVLTDNQAAASLYESCGFTPNYTSNCKNI